jgi:PAS domain-containing protein
MSRAAGPSTESGGGLAESLIDCSPCPAAAVAADGRLLLANPAFRARFGDGDRLPLADAALARLVRRAGEGGGPVEAEVGGAPVTLRVHPLSGDRIAVFGPAPPDPGAELFRAMADHAPDPVMVVDERFAAVYVSPSLQRVVGYEPAEFGST